MRHLLSHTLLSVLCATFIVGAQMNPVLAQDAVPPECRTHDVVVLPALRRGLSLQWIQIVEISTTIIRNSGGDKKIERQITGPIRRQANRALEQALRAVDAFPSRVVICSEPTRCTVRGLEEERTRILLASRKIADVALRLVNRYPDLLGEPAIFVEERIESRFNAFLDGLDFLPPFTYRCGNNQCEEGAPDRSPDQ